jgi:hypothetical protein
MRATPEFLKRPTAVEWRRRARRIALVIMVGAVLAGCDRCGDLAFPGTTACRQEAPKPH